MSHGNFLFFESPIQLRKSAFVLVKPKQMTGFNPVDCIVNYSAENKDMTMQSENWGMEC